jgi:glycosyltransferase involved in cell wall biosynthesis
MTGEQLSIVYVNKVDPKSEASGGGEKRLWEEAKFLSEAGHEITVFGGRMDPEQETRRKRTGVTIRTVQCVPAALVRFPTLYFYLTCMLFPIVSAPAITAYLLRENVDIIVENLTPHSSLAAFIGRLLSIPSAAIVHEYHDRTALQKYPFIIGAIQLVVQNFLRTGVYDAVIVPNSLTKSALKRYGVQSEIRTIPNGLDATEYSSARRSTPEDQYDVVVVSRLVYRKGIDLLLDALREIVAEHASISVAIVGDGPKRSEFEQQANEYDLGDNVNFLGYVSKERKIDLLQGADIFVLPSRQEGFGIAVLEAMAAGNPVVVNEIPVLRQLVSSENGTLVDATSPEDFAASILELLQMPEQEKRAYRTRNRRVAGEYSWTEVGKKAENAYREIASDSSPVKNHGGNDSKVVLKNIMNYIGKRRK